MSSFRNLFDPLRQAATAFFRQEVALRRGENGVHVVLQERAGRGDRKRQPPRDEATVKKEAAELALMREQLGALLSQLPETRRALRALVVVEQMLAKKGLRALRKMPLDVLKRALEQFEGLVTNWSPAGLANLRSKMAVTIIEREQMDPEAEADAYRTAAVVDGEGEDPAADEVEVEVEAESEDDALAAAYAALGSLAPSTVEMHPELGSPSARAVVQHAPAAGAESITLRELNG
jgi:hypothetical protein